MTRLVLFAGAMFVALCGQVSAQDKPAGSIYQQILDNDRVRVFQGNFKPGDKLPSRNFPNHLMYALTDGTLIFVPAGRTGYEVNFKAGDALRVRSLQRATENDSDKEVRVLVVEMKDGGGARVASARGKAKGKARARTRAKGRK
jgi:hypothetical protein